MRVLLITLLVLLSGCTLTIKHDYPESILTNTDAENSVERKACESKALDILYNIEKIDVAKYKKSNDVKGLLEAAFYRLKERRQLVEIVKDDLESCYEDS